MGMLYNLLRINEVCKEHVDNNFLPLPSKFLSRYESLRRSVVAVFDSTLVLLESGDTDVAAPLRCECDKLKDQISATYHSAQRQLRDCDQSEMSVLYVYINVLQEMQELVSGIRKYAGPMPSLSIRALLRVVKKKGPARYCPRRASMTVVSGFRNTLPLCLKARRGLRCVR